MEIGIEFVPPPGGNGENPGGLPKNSQKVKKEEASKGLWSTRATRCLQNFGENLRRMAFKNSFYFCYRKIVYSWRRSAVTDGECVRTTPQRTRFRDVKCKNLGYSLSWRWQDKVGLQHPEEKNFVLGIAYAWWNWTVRRPTPMTTWKPRSTQSTWNSTMTWHTWWTRECARSVVSLRSLALSHSFLAHIAWLKMSECSSHLIHAWSERFLWLPWPLHHLHLPSLTINLKQFLLPFNFHEVK